jgi:hypothetical protein
MLRNRTVSGFAINPKQNNTGAPSLAFALAHWARNAPKQLPAMNLACISHV